MEPADPVVIGTIVAPHGRRGTLRVRATGSGRHLRAGVEPYVAGRRRLISQARVTPKGFLVDLQDVTERSAAAAIRGEVLALDRHELDVPAQDEIYVDDLVGLEVRAEGGEVLGAIQETFETPAHEVLVVGEGPDAPVQYVPFTLVHVPEVDLASGRVIVRPPQV